MTQTEIQKLINQKKDDVQNESDEINDVDIENPSETE